MRQGAVAALLYLQYASVASAASVPRGVGPEFAKFYTDPQTFTCISNPSIRLPFARVNDDYCDCPDGSDEPGTSACAHLSPLSPRTEADALPFNTTLALPGFYCANKGHQPSYLPFSNVNDGICDYQACCDGTEEWEGVGGSGGVKCKDRCDEIGKEWRKADAVRQRSLGAAARKRGELVAEAARLRQSVVDRMQSLGTEIEGAERRVAQMEAELAEVLRTDAAKGGRRAGRLSQLVEAARKRVDDLRENLSVVRLDRDEYKQRLGALETIMSTFKEEYNPNFNDEGVKRAVRAWEDYVASKGADETDAEQDSLLEKLVGADKDNGLDWDDYQGGDEGVDQELELLYSFEAYLPPFLRSWIDQKLREFRTTLITNGILADTAGRGGSSGGNAGESQKVKDARGRLDAAKGDLESHKRTLQESKDDLAKDFGPDDVFRALKGTCVSKDSGEYTYELCFLDRTKQKPKKGGGDTNMGSFVRIETVIVDDELPSDGKGLGSGERIAMKHENGQHCWNGPNRSTTVILACSEENEIWKIMEEEKCVYRMEIGTPAVCAGENKAAAEGVKRDEL